MKPDLFKILVFLQFSLIQILGNFTIFSPMDLRESIQRIPYSIANFGEIPYGKKMTGQLVLAEPLDACKSIKLPFNEQDDKTMKFVLISRGNCTFVQKSYQAQLIGAKVAIVYDNIDEVAEQIILIEDGYGDEINIPTILIPKRAGLELKKYMEQNSNIPVNAIISFDIWKKDVVSYSFWLNIRDRQSYKLVRDFKDYALEFEKEGRAVFWPRYFLGAQHLTEPGNEDCYSDGQYCFMDPDGWGPASGRDMLDEILRQICIYRVNHQKWWDYMDKVDQTCIKPASMKNCGNDLMEQIGIDTTKVNVCMERSFIAKDNYLFDNETYLSKGRVVWPGVSVNNITYRGNLERRDILEVICAAMVNEAEACGNEVDSQRKEGMSKTGLIVMIVVVLFCFFMFLFFCYRRWYQRELMNQIESKANPMVSQYIAFYQTKSQVKNDI